jgi:hypothetical protein
VPPRGLPWQVGIESGTRWFGKCFPPEFLQIVGWEPPAYIFSISLSTVVED